MRDMIDGVDAFFGCSVLGCLPGRLGIDGLGEYFFVEKTGGMGDICPQNVVFTKNAFNQS